LRGSSPLTWDSSMGRRKVREEEEEEGERRSSRE